MAGAAGGYRARQPANLLGCRAAPQGACRRLCQWLAAGGALQCRFSSLMESSFAAAAEAPSGSAAGSWAGPGAAESTCAEYEDVSSLPSGAWGEGAVETSNS